MAVNLPTRWTTTLFSNVKCAEKIDFKAFSDTMLVTLLADFRGNERFAIHGVIGATKKKNQSTRYDGRLIRARGFSGTMPQHTPLELEKCAFQTLDCSTCTSHADGLSELRDTVTKRLAG